MIKIKDEMFCHKKIVVILIAGQMCACKASVCVYLEIVVVAVFAGLELQKCATQ